MVVVSKGRRLPPLPSSPCLSLLSFGYGRWNFVGVPLDCSRRLLKDFFS